MPKLKESTEAKRRKLLQLAIRNHMDIYNMKRQSDVAEHLGLTRQTFACWCRMPDELTAPKIRRLCEVLKLTEEERSWFVCGRDTIDKAWQRF